MRAAGKVMPALADFEIFLPPEPPRPPVVVVGGDAVVRVGWVSRKAQTTKKHTNTRIINTRRHVPVPFLVLLAPLPDMMLVGGGGGGGGCLWVCVGSCVALCCVGQGRGMQMEICANALSLQSIFFIFFASAGPLLLVVSVSSSCSLH